MEVHALTNVLESVQLIYLDPFAIIVSACNLLIIFLIIKKFLYKPVMKIMKEREDQIQSQYDDADKARKEAEESRAIYSERVRHAEEEAEQIIQKANEDAKKLSGEIVSEAGQQAEAIRKKAQSDIEREKEKARAELKKEIADISVDIAGKVVGREIDANDHKRFIDEFVEDVSGEGDGGNG